MCQGHGKVEVDGVARHTGLRFDSEEHEPVSTAKVGNNFGPMSI